METGKIFYRKETGTLETGKIFSGKSKKNEHYRLGNWKTQF